MVDHAERLRRELEWLRREVAAAAGLSDADRVAILEDLWATAEAIRATTTPEQLERDEQARRVLDGPGLERYCALAERLGPSS
ncbi:MAG: hypothetical protein HZB39_13140 [Planctomycetes bacterium]|nr:hypothetical protein [Planctomycetota bacterium]